MYIFLAKSGRKREKHEATHPGMYAQDMTGSARKIREVQYTPCRSAEESKLLDKKNQLSKSPQQLSRGNDVIPLTGSEVIYMWEIRKGRNAMRQGREGWGGGFCAPKARSFLPVTTPGNCKRRNRFFSVLSICERVNAET